MIERLNGVTNYVSKESKVSMCNLVPLLGGYMVNGYLAKYVVIVK